MDNLPNTLPSVPPQPTPQLPNTSQPIQPPTPEETRKFPPIPKWALIAFVVFFVLLLSLGGWWLYNQYSTALNQTETETDFPFNLPTKQSGTISDWTQYANKKCRYSINYPSSWQIYTQAEQEETGTILIASNQVQGETVSGNEVRIQIGCSNIDPRITIQTAVNNLNARYQGQSITMSQTKSTTVAGKTAYHHTLTASSGNASEEYYVFPTVNQVIIINITPANSTQIEMAKSTMQTLTFSSLP